MIEIIELIQNINLITSKSYTGSNNRNCKFNVSADDDPEGLVLNFYVEFNNDKIDYSDDFAVTLEKNDTGEFEIYDKKHVERRLSEIHDNLENLSKIN